MKNITFLSALPICLFFLGACSSDDTPNDDNTPQHITPLPKIENVSLDSHSSSQTVSLPRNVELEGAKVSLKDNSFWISHLTLEGDAVTFDVLENTYVEQGHRFDTIEIKVKNIRVGTICVTQARQAISPSRLAWAKPGATYYGKELIDEKGGLEATKIIYNLEKTTGGKDSYKNYPAFAYCIEMNHDPENNMEWHLPSTAEFGWSQGEHPVLSKHNFWWTTENCEDFGFPLSQGHGTVKYSKASEWWVCAAKNGELQTK